MTCAWKGIAEASVVEGPVVSVNLRSPGVYIQEIPSGSRVISGVATSIVAFVGRATRGPVDEPVAIGSYAEYERVFGGLSRTSGMSYAVSHYFANGGSLALVVRAAGGATAAVVKADVLELIASGPGIWGNAIEVTVAYPAAGDALEIAAAQGVAAADLFHLTVREGSGDSVRLQESFLNVTITAGPRQVGAVLQASQLVRPGGTAPTSGPRPAEGTYTIGTNGGKPGSDGTALSVAADFGDAATATGIYALDKADLFTILCVPPSGPGGDVPGDLWADALGFCQPRRAFLLVDPPVAQVVTTIEAWLGTVGLTGPMARNAAIYFPRFSGPDPLRGGAVGDFAPCGAVAGVMARTDAARGVWKAPAGIDAGLAGASGLSIILRDDDNAALNPLGINCLRIFPPMGPVVWGARTLRGADLFADDYKYVPVRRLALFLEETLYRGTQWVVFEPNDEPLWAQIRVTLGAFMQDLFRKGAFQGRTPREAYFVRCDADTTTQYDIDRGVVNIIVGFAPLKPAEFVVINIQQIAGAGPTV